MCTRNSIPAGGECGLILHPQSVARDFERRCGLRSTSHNLGGPMSLNKDRKELSSGARSIRSTPLVHPPGHSARGSHPEWQDRLMPDQYPNVGTATDFLEPILDCGGPVQWPFSGTYPAFRVQIVLDEQFGLYSTFNSTSLNTSQLLSIDQLLSVLSACGSRIPTRISVLLGKSDERPVC